MPRCKLCKDKFKPKYFLQKHCFEKDECVKAELEMKKAVVWENKKKELKEKLMSYSDHLKLLQTVFNTYIRKRDAKLPCISCGTTKNVKYDAGHFYSVGGYPNVRFDEDNCHKQCSNNCNVHLSGNIHEYKIGLIRKIGADRFYELEKRAKQQVTKLSIPEIKEKINYYKLKIKLLK